MPFPPEVRTQALVLAARHCCVCHRYKGVKVEVHHIVQETDGGPNTADNAIALCFDCHTDAGHYNPQHPRGTKFSASELRRARDVWHEIVQKGPIPQPATADALYCRYFICRNFEAICEHVRGDISSFPVRNPLLARTTVLDFLGNVVRAQGATYRHPRVWGEGFQKEDEYTSRFPEAVKTQDVVSDGWHWWEYVRKPTLDDLRGKLGQDYPCAKMLDSGMKAENVSTVRAFTDECGGVALQEEYLLRPVWVVYLCVTNTSDTRIRLTGLDVQVLPGTDTSFRPMASLPEGTRHKVQCPTAEVPPDTTVVFPIATVLGPIGEIAEESAWKTDQRVTSGAYQEISHAAFPGRTVGDSYLWGPALHSPEVRFVTSAVEQVQPVHELDLGNIYVIDRYWAMGCCPHIFAIWRNGTTQYLGELFPAKPGIPQRQVISVSDEIAKIVIAELDDETTFISNITNGKRTVAENVVLNKGEFLAIHNETAADIVVAGRYELLFSAPDHVRRDRHRNRRLVQAFGRQLGRFNNFAGEEGAKIIQRFR